MKTLALDKTVRQLSASLLDKQLRMATAESCTGGWIAQQLTRLPGSSDWFECGFVTYSNDAKQRLLGVSPDTLALHGAVSEAVVREMVAGALDRSRAQLAVAVSGVAGPGGGTLEKPVGLVWLAWGLTLGAGLEADITARAFEFQGSRYAIRRQSVEVAVSGLLEQLKK